MSTGFSHLEHDLVELGHAAQKLIWHADSYWLNAEYGDEFPSRVYDELIRVVSILGHWREHEVDQQLRGFIEQVGEVAQRAFGAFRASWQQSDHQHFIGARGVPGMEDVPAHCWDQHSPLATPAWQEFQQRLRQLCDMLPRKLGLCIELGTCLSQVFDLGPSAEEAARRGDRFPIPSLQALLFEARDAYPILGDLDVTLSPIAFHGAGRPYIECAQEKAVWLHREILRRLGAASTMAENDGRMRSVHGVPAAGAELGGEEDSSQTVEEQPIPRGPETDVETVALQGPAGGNSAPILTAADLRRYGDAAMSCPDIAARCGVKEDALRRRLERWRRDHDQGWNEVQNHGPREPRYLYQAGSIADIIDEMTSGERSAERSAD